MRARMEFLGVDELRGPLLVVRGVTGVGWDEFATVRLADGTTRHGLVLEVDRDLAVLQVLEGTEGIEPAGTRVSFAGMPLAIPVGDGWLGRVCNGRGEPLDGGPPVFGPTTAPVNGLPLNPAWRQPPAEPVLTGDLGDRRADHAGAGPEAARLLGAGAAAPRAGRADRRPGLGRGRAVLRRLRGHGADPRRRRPRARHARGAVGLGRAGAAAQHRRRPGDRAGADPAAGAHGRGAPGLRWGPARTGGHG